METVGIVYWREQDGFWVGHLEAYPDYLTQGETLEDLKENLKDIVKELGGNAIPMVRVHEKMAI
ncbi:MAG: hypothetical protein AUK55_04395 [Syntrophobacteraceae bacterium CG2_30_61_12]|nr:MAG: hypothetical protein AUK55_04395 [Syntrophobacteraceae bacterium CG2_30_61_12]PIU31743.1 MAG: hypothetical protein COT06_06530 [Syntrophobacteraceae bacterium CG07_land_8_20_14_0_80_61_8]